MLYKRLLALCFVLFLSAIAASVGHAQSQTVVDLFEERTFRFTAGQYQDAEIRYRLFVPERIRPGRRYPLVVHLHGIGEAGSCNRHSLLYLDSIMPVLAGRQRQDFFMLVLQAPRETPGWSFNRSTQDGTLDVLVAAMEHVIAENPIDMRRITATGVSSGGWGVWQLIMAHPDKFAGAVPTACGAPPPSQRLAALTKTPIWSIVNRDDINPESLQIATRVINSAGGSKGYTITNHTGHGAWGPAMEDYNSIQWMLAQKRGGWFTPPPGVIVHNRPQPLFLAFFLFVLPLAIIVFLTWGTISEWISTVYQSARAWAS